MSFQRPASFEERQPTVAQRGSVDQAAHGRSHWLVAKVAAAGCYILLGTVVPLLNKWILTAGGFPHVLPLVVFHMLATSGLSGIVFAICPSLFPSLHGDTKSTILRSNVGRLLWLVALAFVAAIVTSNLAMQSSTLAFQQHVKAMTVIVVFVLASAAGLEHMSLLRVGIVLGIAIASCIYIPKDGELHGSWIALMLLSLGLILECMKVVLQQILLTGRAGQSLDPLSFLLLASTLCGFCATLVLAVGHLVSPSTQFFLIPGHDAFLLACPSILINGALACVLNVMYVFLLASTSAMGVILIDALKEIFILCVWASWFAEPLTSQQNVAFFVQCVLVGAWAITTLGQETRKDQTLGNMLQSILPSRLMTLMSTNPEKGSLASTYGSAANSQGKEGSMEYDHCHAP